MNFAPFEGTRWEKVKFYSILLGLFIMALIIKPFCKDRK